MHEKLADAFESLLTVIVIICGVILLLVLVAGGRYGLLVVLPSAFFLILAVGSISVLISMRRALLAIRDELRQQGIDR